jgi:TPR repeat protein
MLALVVLSLSACASTYHAEYHPESQYSYVQNVTYAQNAFVLPAAPNVDSCTPGHPAECWWDCFKRLNGDACDLLSVMYEIGDQVQRDHANAARLQERACELGACGGLADLPAEASAGRGMGSVSSAGGVIVLGDFNGTINVAP